MATEEEKLDIEDIKAPEEEEAQEEMDLEEVVSDDPEEPAAQAVETKTESKKEKKRKLFSRKSKESKQKAEKKPQKVEKEKVVPVENTEKKKSGLKTTLLVILTMLLTAAVVLGAVYFWLSREKVAQPEPQTTKEEVVADKPKQESKNVYVNSDVGLNLRKEPLKTAEVLAIIPFGTKLAILDENGEWFQTEYESKTGWVMKEYTTTENPLIYKNDSYGFQLTFPSTWAGYKLVKKTMDGGSIAFYVGLPTTDKNWTDSSGESNFGSLFALDVYTGAQWAIVQAEEGPKPAKIGEKGNYIFAWMPGQATPSDLTARYDEVKQIIATFKVN